MIMRGEGNNFYTMVKKKKSDSQLKSNVDFYIWVYNSLLRSQKQMHISCIGLSLTTFLHLMEKIELNYKVKVLDSS